MEASRPAVGRVRQEVAVHMVARPETAARAAAEAPEAEWVAARVEAAECLQAAGAPEGRLALALLGRAAEAEARGVRLAAATTVALVRLARVPQVLVLRARPVLGARPAREQPGLRALGAQQEPFVAESRA